MSPPSDDTAVHDEREPDASARSGLWTKARMSCAAANHLAETVTAQYQSLLNHVTPISLNGSAADGLAAVQVLRDATDAAASKPYLIDFLHVNRISEEDFVQVLEREKEHPLLVLKSH